MARTTNLTDFLTDVADAIRTKKGTSETIQASDFDTEIENLPSGGGGLDWSAIGYNGTPQVIKDGYDYAVEIKNNWVPNSDLSNKFYNDLNLKIMPLVDTSIATDMYGMFMNSGISTIPLLDTSNVTNMTNMFANVSSLTTIPLLNTSKVTNMNSMFYNSNISTIPLLDTSSVTNMSYMFYYSGISTIPLLDTSSVTNMSYMFHNSGISTIPLLNTSKVTNMSYMFADVSSLTTIPLLDTSSVTNMSSMFSNVGSLTDESLDNILQMCINATSYKGKKTLYQLGLRRTYYPASKIQALPHYQDFLDAGWTIGY